MLYYNYNITHRNDMFVVNTNNKHPTVLQRTNQFSIGCSKNKSKRLLKNILQSIKQKPKSFLVIHPKKSEKRKQEYLRLTIATKPMYFKCNFAVSLHKNPTERYHSLLKEQIQRLKNFIITGDMIRTEILNL